MAPAAAAPYDRRLTALVILWNVVSSLACIFLNKMVFLTLNWPSRGSTPPPPRDVVS